ncbi:hypothetical protein V757_11425 [Pelistega indica]|uniref:Tyr recombinase domain-containing protein n=1 Tax=Pelistega indica TaxID=1414851 RepID=V8FUN5_9BURK|nr:integrase arm-type DNA-binding domain-containing protein [Pelistega indica]ETD67428.1 hypothetical protein V757_11425 [Pelistega indica]
MALTERQCRAFVATDKVQKFADGKGLTLVVHPNGSKYWHGRYRVGGKEQTKSLGAYPEVSLASAREQWAHFKESPLLPTSHRLTVTDVYARVEGWRASKGYKRDRNLPTTFAKLSKPLQHAYVDEVTPKMLAFEIERVSNSDKKSIPHSVKRLLNLIFELAIDIGQIEQNPAARLHRLLPTLTYTPFPCMDKTMVGDYVTAIHHPKNKISLRLQLFLKLSLLTATRSIELRNARWSHIDVDNKLWVIPKALMKADADHIVPLADITLDLFKFLHRLGEDDLLFKGGHRAMLPSTSSTSYIHDSILGLKGKHCMHGNRSLFTTVMQEDFGWGYKPLDVQLAHTKWQETAQQSYDRATFLPQRVEIMTQWANWLDDQARSAEGSLGGIGYPIL